VAEKFLIPLAPHARVGAEVAVSARERRYLTHGQHKREGAMESANGMPTNKPGARTAAAQPVQRGPCRSPAEMLWEMSASKCSPKSAYDWEAEFSSDCRSSPSSNTSSCNPPREAEYRVPDVRDWPLARVAVASAAFPPVLGPMRAVREISHTDVERPQSSEGATSGPSSPRLPPSAATRSRP
jgi:hypothetical protein